MKLDRFPPGQHEINHILKWNIEHPGITPKNPQINLKTWELTVNGEVQNPLKLSWRDLLKFPATQSTSDFHCVEGWSVRNCGWYGVKFSTLVQTVKPSANAKHAFFKCRDGYTTSLTIEELLKEDVILAYKLDGKPLEKPLGGPLRLIVPQKYAYKSAMWIEQIIFTIAKELGVWEKKGYSDTADVWKNDRSAK